MMDQEENDSNDPGPSTSKLGKKSSKGGKGLAKAETKTERNVKEESDQVSKVCNFWTNIVVLV
jgi:hypothetical protein